MPKLSPILFLCVFLLPAQAAQRSPDYLSQLPVFWKNLYPDGGVGLYCGQRFQRYDKRYNVEHVYPMSWVAKALNCGKRKQCRKRSERFRNIEADMHNMYPARKDINKIRGAMAFDLVPGEQWLEAGCDVEIDRRKYRVEPRPEVRGNIARAMLYMSDRYGLELHRRQKQLMLQWHEADPVDAQERERNRRIARLQGNPNPWIKQ